MKKAREGYKMTELGEIPEDWEVKKITDVAEINPNYKLIKGEPYDYIDMASLPTETRKFGNISIRKYGNISGSKFKNGDILFARITPCTENGKIGFVDCLNSEYGIGSTEFIVLSPKDCQVEPSYLYYYVKTNIVRSYAINRMIGTTGRQRVPNEVFREELSIPIPSLKEQRKIADILSTVDEHIEETECLIEKTKELKKGLMQRLLTKGIGHTRFKKTEIGEIPVEWEVKTIGELIEDSIPGEWGKEAESPKDALPIIRSTNFCNNGKLDLNNIAYRKIDPLKVNKIIISRGDILLEKSGGGPDQPVGRVVYFNENGTFGYANFIQRLVINKKYNSKTVFYFLHYFYLTGQVLRYQQQTTGIINFQLKDFLNTAKIGIPINLQEQNEISNILTKVDDKIEHYKNYKDKLNVLKKGLMQKLLTGKIRVY